VEAKLLSAREMLAAGKQYNDECKTELHVYLYIIAFLFIYTKADFLHILFPCDGTVVTFASLFGSD
jgi:hypothetical protein